MLPELPYWEGLLRLALSGVLAGLIGIERERRDQEAGLRTHMLVCLGACLFMIVGVYAWAPFEFNQNIGAIVDPSRVASYVVAGIGFLGGGAIIKYGANIKGLTTAASIWVVAAIGVALGVGMYAFAVTATVLVLFSLWPLRSFALWVGIRQKGARRVFVDLGPEGQVAAVLAAVEGRVEIESIDIDEEGGARRVALVVADVDRGDEGPILDALHRVEHVRSVSWAA